MKISIFTITILGVISSISGCSYLNIGESEYSCPGKKLGVTCAGTRTLYEYTAGGRIPSGVPVDVARNLESTLKIGSDANSDSIDSSTTNNQIKPESVNPLTSASKGADLHHVDELTLSTRNVDLGWSDVPVRTPSRVMRIWIAPWTDLEGDLNVPGYIYTEIETRRWIFNEPVNSNQNLFNSIK